MCGRPQRVLLCGWYVLRKAMQLRGQANSHHECVWRSDRPFWADSLGLTVLGTCLLRCKLADFWAGGWKRACMLQPRSDVLSSQFLAVRAQRKAAGCAHQALILHVVRAAGVFPFRTAMAEDRPKAGYVEVTPTAACPLFPPGQPARGYVHHCSEILQVRRSAA